ncbi:ribonuclease P protein component [Mycobacterium sp.]|uniref:ribonuclease P protein component n=1 Tax=Mycobacterium sp. TaxID=1785 RepID=UPI002BF648C3|nr:ribonuclease P protein component [Mycobacterium sp.]HME47962.1 ribonuclease P protein component [Mycobacterium sp.]
MLPAQNRMTRSMEFGATVKHGARAVEPDIVVHAQRAVVDGGVPGPRIGLVVSKARIGLVVSKAVGSAVQRHRVARRLRHAARLVVDELEAGDRVVIRALPSSRDAISARLEQQLRDGLIRARLLPGGEG